MRFKKKKKTTTKQKTKKPAAVLISGQRYIDGDPTKPDGDFLPLETFKVQRNQYFKFRTINVGFLAAFEISVDDVRYYTSTQYNTSLNAMQICKRILTCRKTLIQIQTNFLEN